jgi:hypothetical protein
MKRTAFPLGMACVAALCGLLMSTLPYVAWDRTAHSTVWIADADEIQYTLIASHAYYWHPLYLSDPTFVKGGQSVYSWLQLIPAELVCKVFEFRPIRFGLVLRIFAGLAVGFGWYSLIWQHVRRPWITLVGAIFLLTDGSWAIMRPFVKQGTIFVDVLLNRSNQIFAHNPGIQRDWRIISPAVVLPFLFLYLWTLRRSLENFSRARIICSGLAFGILFFAYFYFWTAAGLGLIFGLFVDRAQWRTYFHTGWIGGLVGTPELARMLLTRHGQGSEWMQRFDEFVPISRWSEHGHFFFSAALVVITFAIVWRFSRELLYLWCISAAGLIWIHQQLFTGLQMENYHWAYLFCPCITLLLVLLVIDGIERIGARGRIAGGFLVTAVLLNAGAGAYLRMLEAIRTKDSRRYSLGYQDYENQHSSAGYQPLVAGAVTAGTDDFVQFAMIVDHVTPLAAAYPVLLSPSVSDLDYDRRIAFNAYLSGSTRQQFEASQTWELNHLQYGVELRELTKRAARLASRLAYFDEITSNPSAAMNYYQVRYVALPMRSARPAVLTSDWMVLQSGPAWEVWERTSGQ